MAGGRELLSNFVPFVCARPFRTHVQEGGEEDCVQVLVASRADFGLQVVTPAAAIQQPYRSHTLAIH